MQNAANALSKLPAPTPIQASAFVRDCGRLADNHRNANRQQSFGGRPRRSDPSEAWREAIPPQSLHQV